MLRATDEWTDQDAAYWKSMARRHEGRAKESHARVLELQAQVESLRTESRRRKNAEHTWRILYQDLLEKVGRKLDLEGEIYE